MKYHIRFSDYDATKLEHQVANALEKMVEQQSRAAAPAVWKLTDKLNVMPKASDDVLKRRQFRRKIYGIMLIALGGFLFVPSVMDWQNMIFPLMVSICAIAWGLTRFIPRKNKGSRFLISARKVLSEKPPFADITFRNEDIMLGSVAAIPYTGITHLIETEDTYIIVFEKGMALIQKKDVPQSHNEEQESFAQFIARLTGKPWQN